MASLPFLTSHPLSRCDEKALCQVTQPRGGSVHCCWAFPQHLTEGTVLSRNTLPLPQRNPRRWISFLPRSPLLLGGSSPPDLGHLSAARFSLPVQRTVQRGHRMGSPGFSSNPCTDGTQIYPFLELTELQTLQIYNGQNCVFNLPPTSKCAIQ